jgi:hypothetical protein
MNHGSPGIVLAKERSKANFKIAVIINDTFQVLLIPRGPRPRRRHRPVSSDGGVYSDIDRRSNVVLAELRLSESVTVIASFNLN